MPDTANPIGPANPTAPIITSIPSFPAAAYFLFAKLLIASPKLSPAPTQKPLSARTDNNDFPPTPPPAYTIPINCQRKTFNRELNIRILWHQLFQVSEPFHFYRTMSTKHSRRLSEYHTTYFRLVATF